MEFLTINMLAYAFHYVSKLEAKHKGESHFTTKLIGQTSNKKSPTKSNKSRHPSQPIPPNPDYRKKKSPKEKREHRKQPLPGNGVIITIHHGMIR